MTNKYKMAIVGAREATQGFEALGMIAIDSTTKEETIKKLFEMKKSGEYAVIFILEDTAKLISKDDYQRLTNSALPALITLPGTGGSTGYGIRRIKDMVERAVGQDILGD